MQTPKTARAQALQRQIDRLGKRIERLHRISNRLSWLRLGIFSTGLLLGGVIWYFFGLGYLFWGDVTLTLGLFVVIVLRHRRLNYNIDQHTVWRQIKLAHLARMHLDWDQLPGVSRFQPHYSHPFEADLDLTGDFSLHRLLDTAVSLEGSRYLRNWLTNTTPSLEIIHHRQALVRELIPRTLFRDKLALHATIAAGTHRMWEAQRLSTWLQQRDPRASLPALLAGLTGLAVVNLGLVVLALTGVVPSSWPITSYMIYFGLLMLNAQFIGNIFEQAMALQAALQQLQAVFHHLETTSYRQTPHLQALCQPFLNVQQRPSRYLNRINRITIAAGLRQNPLMWLVLNGLLPWDMMVAYVLDQRRAELAHSAPEWMDIWFQLEALSALANMAYLNPQYSMPAVAPANNTAPVLSAIQMGHPLIPEEHRVNNDFSMTEMGDIAIITGSNMAGKSTFLRTIGLNLALAYAGGPVNARQLQVGLFRIFTCIKVTDSVTNGISYFYAEVKRLRALLNALEAEKPLPLFFLIDEIFKGTNNRERFIGSKAYIQTLAGQHGIGLISTHDLELATLADQVPAISNYHFRDDVDGEQMVFDYLLRTGPCPTTNALKLMQLEGLPVG
jgi:hypothetical protein